MGAAKKVFLGQCRTWSPSRGAERNDSSLTNVLGLRIGDATGRALSMARIKDHFSSRKTEFVARIQQVTSRKSKVRPASPCRERPEARKVSSLVFILLFLSVCVFWNHCFPWFLSPSLWPNAAHMHTCTHLPAPSPRVGLASWSDGTPASPSCFP